MMHNMPIKIDNYFINIFSRQKYLTTTCAPEIKFHATQVLYKRFFCLINVFLSDHD